jgi:class 3 adenylate cyclase
VKSAVGISEAWRFTSPPGSVPLRGSGDVLVSGTVRDLVVGSDIRFEERGEHPLKGVPGSWRLFAAIQP